MNKKIGYIRVVSYVLCILLNLWCVSASSFASAEVDLILASQRTGNVFFDGDVPSIEISLKNFNTEDSGFTLVYEVEKNELGGGLTQVSKTNESITITGGGSIKRVFEYDASEYGVYNLKVSVLDESGNSLCTKETEFSKVIKNDVQNPHHGVCVHLVRMGDADTELAFAKNAGFSMVRDDFTWGEYESSRGEKKLSERHRNFLKKADKYNLDVLAIVGGNHSAYNPYYNSENPLPSLPNDLDAFAAFVDSLLSEDKFGTVKKIEIQNEPQSYYVIKDGEYYYGQDYIDKLAPQYAGQMIAASEVIRNKRPDIEIGGFSLCLTGQEKTDDFIKSVYDYLEQNYDGKEPFDTITIHPYTARAGKTIGETVTHYKSVAAEEGFDADNTDVWCTEYGTYTSESISQTAQARRIIRDYAQIKSQRFTDELYIYDMADDSGTYGLVKHSTNAKVPYAAKISYLAVSALNKMTGGAENCVKSEDENNLSDVYDFSYADGDVYMIYPKADGEFVYNFGEGDLHYYDMLGNEITETKCKEYFDVKIPYYVMRNMQITQTADDAFSVTGNIKSGLADKNVSLTVLKEGTAFDENMYGKIQYAEQKKTGAEGSFEFRFDLTDKSDNLVGYVVSEDDSNPLTFALRGELKALRLYSGTTEINSLNLDLLDLSEASVKIDFSDIGEQGRYHLICGFYDDERLVRMKMCESAESDTYDISTDESFDYDTVKIFMFNSMTECMPLCSASVIGRN